MRCPKCGYFSFDHLESCKKCKKFIGDVKSELNGTAFEALPPAFLQSVFVHPQQESVPPTVPGFKPHQEALRDESTGDAAEEDGGIDFILEEPDLAPPRPKAKTADKREELIVDMEAFGEVSPHDDFTLDLEEKAEDFEAKLPALDFGDLDISDLAPPTGQPGKPLDLAEEKEELAGALGLEEIEPVASLSSPPLPPKTPATKSTGLEDLNFNGLDLDSPSKLVTGSAAGKRYLPSVKTGTALDKFDIDLGDLFSEGKK